MTPEKWPKKLREFALSRLIAAKRGRSSAPPRVKQEMKRMGVGVLKRESSPGRFHFGFVILRKFGLGVAGENEEDVLRRGGCRRDDEQEDEGDGASAS